MILLLVSDAKNSPAQRLTDNLQDCKPSLVLTRKIINAIYRFVFRGIFSSFLPILIPSILTKGCMSTLVRAAGTLPYSYLKVFDV